MRNRSLRTVQAAAVESLYDHNLTRPENLPLSELIVTRLQLVIRLEEWGRRVPLQSFHKLLSSHLLETHDSGVVASSPLESLLLLEYYKTTFLINSPILQALLVRHFKQGQPDSVYLQEQAFHIIDDIYCHARQMERLILLMNAQGSVFIDTNAAWWTCNYLGTRMIPLP